MTLHRFFTDEQNIKKDRIFLSPVQSKHITKVIRLKKGDQIIVLDNLGNEFLLELDQMISDNVSGKIIKTKPNTAEPALKISLYQSLTTREKFENILQKGTEIGISKFIPTETKRSLVKSKDLKPEKIERYKRIVTEAAEQSERGIVPEILPVTKLEEAVAEAIKKGSVIIAWEGEDNKNISHITLNTTQEIAVFIGPEGGFEESEIKTAKSLGALAVSLGPRVLRTETAGTFIAGILLFLSGDLDQKRTVWE